MAKIVEEPKDDTVYRVKCVFSECGRKLEYDQSDIREITTNKRDTVYGISCPTCGRIIANEKLKSRRRPKDYKSLWQRIFG